MLSVRVARDFGGFALDVAFEAPAGVSVLFGRSGSGKSSVINAVAGLLRPQGGRIAVGDEVLFDADRGVMVPPHRRRMGYVFQDARLFSHLNVRQNLRYGQRFAPAGPGPDLTQVVELLGLEPLLSRRPATLSGGERQRVAIGRALLSRPRMLLMDEPLAALDEGRKAEILPYLERLRDRLGLPILYVSHSVPEVARLAQTLILIEGGRVIAAGPAAAVMADPALAPVIGLREAGAVIPARLVAQDADGLSRLETDGGAVFLPRIEAAPGTVMQLRVLAQDVMLATTRPAAISALNVLGAQVVAIHPGPGPEAMVQLRLGMSPPMAERPDGALMLARVTRRSVAGLGLTPGQPVFAIVKSVAVSEGRGAQILS